MKAVYYFLLTLRITEAAKILAIVATASRSHGIWNRALLEGLASKGHQVTAMIADPGEDGPNLKYINLENSYEFEDTNITMLNFYDLGVAESFNTVYGWYAMQCTTQMQSEGFKTVLGLQDDFDLVLFEAVGNECFLGLLQKFKAPVVAVSAFGYSLWINERMGVPELSSVFPNPVLSFGTNMNFRQRLLNTLVNWYDEYIRKIHYLPFHVEAAKQIFGADLPFLSKLESRYALALVNSGPAGVDPARVKPPTVIEVGCLQCRPGKPLPKDLQDFLDSAKEGAIFFSLGSNIRSDKMPPEKIQIFLQAFAELPQKVLWKWESDSLPGQPSNVKLGKWLPQQDILAHSNVRAFMTHGGRLSTQESMYHGVPIVAVPFFLDQVQNSHRLVSYGLGERLNYATLTKEDVLRALNGVVNNRTMSQLAKTKSKLFRDQPETPLDRAVFWTEYVIRHKGAPHLRSASLDLSWYQLHLLDVAAFVVLALVSLVVAICASCRALKRLCCAESEKKKKKLQ